jgi:hypothetical protein
MTAILLAISAAGILATMIGLVALGVIGTRKLHDREEERNLSRYRRRMLLGMLESRDPQPH